jgi:hypothetical protein
LGGIGFGDDEHPPSMVESHGLQTRRALPSGTNALWIAMAVTANIPAATAGGRRLVEVYGGLMAKTKPLATSGACSASSGRSGASPSMVARNE